MLALLAVLALVAARAAAATTTSDARPAAASGGDERRRQCETRRSTPSNCAPTPTAGIEGDTIKLVSSFPQSGLTAAFAEIAQRLEGLLRLRQRGEGGVEIAGKKYKIEIEDKDDEYNAAARPRTNIEELVGTDGDGAFAVFSVVGTANNIAIRDFLGELCVPNLFAATGSPAWGNPELPVD